MTTEFFDQLATDQADLATRADPSVVHALVTSLRTLQTRIANGKTLLAELEAQERQLLQRELPDALRQMGVASLGLDDGTTLTLTEKVQTNITEARREEAHAWLIAHGHGGVIKRLAALDLGKTDDDEKRAAQEQALEALAASLEAGLSIEEKVHAQTLKALVREILATEQEHPELPADARLPRDVFSVFVVTEVDVKEPRASKKKSR